MKKRIALVLTLEPRGRHMTDAKFRIGRFSRVCLVAFSFIALVSGVSAQEKRYALVIGNGVYEHVTKLTNPTNDAKDMADELKGLGFIVDLLVDRDLSAMEDAVVRFGNRLSISADAVGFFYYAGHGVQSAGTNYLIPTEANIPSASFLRQKALALQSVLDTLQASGNKLNVVVLDACRDNPFSWSRSGTRGLTVVGAQPPGSIIVYATSAGSVAQDGQGRNGVFTGELLKHIRSPGTDVSDVFKQTGAAVSADTLGSQIPAIYTQFFGSYAFLTAAASGQQAATPTMSVTRSYGSLVVTAATEGTLYLDGIAMGDVPAGSNAKLDSVEVGERGLELRYADGQVEQHTATVEAGNAASVSFTYRKAPPAQGGNAGQTTDFFKLAKTGTSQDVQAAINQGADIKAKDKNGLTALMWAAMHNQNPEVITTLLKAGADIKARDSAYSSGLTALMWAAEYNNNPEVITLLLKAGADIKAKDKNDMTSLMYAVLFNQNPEVITALLYAGADIKDRNSSSGMTALMYAVQFNQYPEVITLLLKAGADIKARDKNDRTTLMHAAEKNQSPEVITTLLKAGADPKAKDRAGKTAFDYARDNPNPEVIATLLKGAS